MNNYRYKSILNTGNAIFNSLAPNGSFLQHCLINSKWDDEFNKTSSLAHYNLRLAISKLLALVDIDNDEHQPLVLLLQAEPETLSVKELIQGYKSLELVLLNNFPLKRAKAYSTGVRYFFNNFSTPIANNFKADDLPYETLLASNIEYRKNPKIDLFTINVNKGKGITSIDPDTFPTLFEKDSVLHKLLINLENASNETPFNSGVISNFKSILREVNKWAQYSEMKILLNQPLRDVTTSDVLNALLDFEKRLLDAFPNRKSNQLSMLFRQKLFDYGLTSPELSQVKDQFKTNFDRSGKLKFKPKFKIKCEETDYHIDGFQLASLIPSESVGEHCLKTLALRTVNSPADINNISELIDILKLLMQEGYDDARLLFSRKPQNLTTRHVSRGIFALESLIAKHFPNNKKEKLQIIREFLNLCEILAQNGKLLKEFEFDSSINPKEKNKTMAFQGYKKNNGIKSNVTVEFNLTKLKPLLKLNSTLVTALNELQIHTNTTAMPTTTLRDIEHTLGYIVDTEIEITALKRILTSPLSALSQRDFKLGFSQLEDVIDKQKITLKAPRSQNIRTFLSKHAGKINAQILISDCGFKSRFSALDEMNAQKLIEPVDENGDVLPSPVLNQQQSLSDLRKNVQQYFEKPIIQILEACVKEFECYERLVKELNIYTEINSDGLYKIDIPEEVSNFVENNQLEEGKAALESEASTLRKKFTPILVLGAYLRHQLISGRKKTTLCKQKSQLIPVYVKHWFLPTATGMKELFWAGVFLPKNILLVCFIRLVIRTTWNKDVIATLTRNSMPMSLPEGPFKLSGFKEKVNKETTPVTIEPHEKEIRQAISFLIQHHDNMASFGFKQESIWDYPDVTSKVFLSANIIDRFSKNYTLPYFRMELLAKHQMNLRKGIDGSLFNSQRERNHATSKVTYGYLTHPIAVIEYEANNADFQRKFETTVQFRHRDEMIEKYGLDRNNIDENLIVAPDEHKADLPDWFLLPDGSLCTDIFAPVDKSKRDSICKGRKCHAGEGCEFNRVDLGIDEFERTLRHQLYYIARGEALLAKHGREYFEEYIAPDMRFTFGLAKYVELANPNMFKDAKGRLENGQ